MPYVSTVTTAIKRRQHKERLCTGMDVDNEDCSGVATLTTQLTTHLCYLTLTTHLLYPSLPQYTLTTHLLYQLYPSLLRLRDTDSGQGHMVKSNVYNFGADAYAAIN